MTISRRQMLLALVAGSAALAIPGCACSSSSREVTDNVFILEPTLAQANTFRSFASASDGRREVERLRATFGDGTLGVLKPDRGWDDQGEYDVFYFNKEDRYTHYDMLAAVWAAGVELSNQATLPAQLGVPQQLAVELMAVLDSEEFATRLYGGVTPFALPRRKPKHYPKRPKQYVAPKATLRPSTTKPQSTSARTTTTQPKASVATSSTKKSQPPK